MVVILFVRMWVEISCLVRIHTLELVILFVRMWVEMLSPCPEVLPQLSSSSWGCELKYLFFQRPCNRIQVILFVRMWVEIIYCKSCLKTIFSHPLREDVSWNNINLCLFNLFYVILFVRMWVEIAFEVSMLCFVACHPLREDVSWNVKFAELNDTDVSSSSSWGCELKCFSLLCRSSLSRHPLREDVSWNNLTAEDAGALLGHPLREDVSWNAFFVPSTSDSSSHPLREDVSWNIVAGTMLADRIVILFVRMWVEMILYDDPSKKYTSSSSWGCELKC